MLYRGLRMFLACWLLPAFAMGQVSPAAKDGPSPKAPAALVGNIQPSVQPLVMIQTITAPAELATDFYPPLRCDSDGNLYFRRDHLDAVHKISPKGEPLAQFQAAANTNKKIDLVMSFTLGPNDDLYELVFPHEFDRYVFVYRRDGAFKSAIKLTPGFVFSPHALAVFPSGQLLVAGSEYGRDRSAAKWPFTGIFAEDGSLLKEIKLEDDETLHDMAAAGDERVTMPQNPQANKAVDFSQIGMAADGNAYLMRWTNPAIIYAISPGGEVLRRLKIDPEGRGYHPASMQVHQNQMAVLFFDPQTHSRVMKVIDLEGHDLGTYDEPKADGKGQGPILGSSFACYTGNPARFTFLGSNDDNRLQFYITGLR